MGISDSVNRNIRSLSKYSNLLLVANVTSPNRETCLILPAGKKRTHRPRNAGMLLRSVQLSRDNVVRVNSVGNDKN
jgi:hypothetical protein